jgi:hypothetical protein
VLPKDLALLNTYGSEREPVAAWVLEWTRAQVSTLQPDLFGAAVQTLIRDLIDTTDGTRTHTRLSGAARRISSWMMARDWAPSWRGAGGCFSILRTTRRSRNWLLVESTRPESTILAWVRRTGAASAPCWFDLMKLLLGWWKTM